MIEDIAERDYRAEDGRTYRVTLAPLERGVRSRKPGVDPRVRAVVFEGEDGWVGSAPIHRRVPLWAVTEEEMAIYLYVAQALG